MQRLFDSCPTASGLPWRVRGGEARTALAMAQQHGISELLAEILAARGVEIDQVPGFLAPTLREALPDPFHLRDMDKAVERLLQAMARRETIGIFGDYDVDGATSTALLMRYFAALSVPTVPYIPDRMTEGYGPTEAGFARLIEKVIRVESRESSDAAAPLDSRLSTLATPSLIITVDCGTLAHAPIAYARARGVDVIVLDHHLSSGTLPEAYAIVNPNRVDETSPHRNLAAVGVVFLLLVALNARLKERGQRPEARGQGEDSRFSSRGELSALKSVSALASDLWPLASPPSLLPLLDLVALGTVADVMPLTGLNRVYVAQGLKVMAQRRNLGLAQLADVARMEEAPGTYHLGFLLGPRINAGGRVGKSSLGVRLLTSEDPEAVQAIALELDRLNAERQAIEASVLEQALLQAATQANLPVILVAGEGWHEGVIGIVAGRLKEKFERPALVIALAEGMGKGSGRSVPGVDMGAAIHAAVAEGLLQKGGGHAMAAGFSLAQQNVAALQQFLIARMERAVAAYTDARVKKYDGLLSVSGATLETLEDIGRAGPFGLGNPAPHFVIPSARIVQVSVMKEKHLRLTLADDSGSGRLAAVAFHSVGTTLGEWLQHERRVHVMGELKINRWQGRETAQFLIEDAARIIA